MFTYKIQIYETANLTYTVLGHLRLSSQDDLVWITDVVVLSLIGVRRNGTNDLGVGILELSV